MEKTISVIYKFKFKYKYLWSWRGVLDTTSCDKVSQWFGTGRWFSTGTRVSPPIKLTATI